MSKSFVYNRFDVYANWPFNLIEEQPDAEGEYVKAEDAINHHAVLMARIRTLEVQLKDARRVAVTADHEGTVVCVTRQDAEGKILSIIWEK